VRVLPSLFSGIAHDATKERIMLGTLLLIFLILMLLGALPTWPYSRGWGYYPSGTVSVLLVVLVVLLITGHI
jgi:hypothetical protein